MAYACPRCGGPVQRGSNTGATVAAGLVGALVVAAFGNFQCKTCGKIAKSEFPADVRSKMTRGSVLLAVLAVVLFIGVVALLIYLPQR